MIDPSYLFILGAICLIPSLIAGAWRDMKTRTFPKAYWIVPSRVAGFFVFIGYLLLIAGGSYEYVLFLAIGSPIAAAVFYWFGIRYGSGGDWRALMYIAVLAPFVLFSLTFWIAFFISSLIIAFIILAAKQNDTHAFEVHIPWSLAICSGFCITLLCIIFTGGA